MLVNLNGKLVSKEDAKISVFDHGLLYGDGVFEGIRIYDGNIFRLKEHIDRLYNSAKFIMLDIGMSKEQMIKETIKVVSASKIRNGYIRLVVTRGVGDLGLDPRKCSKPTYFIIVDNIKLYPEEFYKKGLEITTVAIRRNISEALNPQVKSLNYLNNILAKIEAINHGSFEAVMINEQGYVTEATGDNIFIVKNGQLFTTPPYIGVLEGITRETVIEIANSLKIKTHEKIMTRYDLYTADECFLTGTAAEVIPVVKIDARVINDGTPGSITKKIIREFKKKTKILGVKVKYD
ncbi:MAG: branched-chain-amino-acid transaminase [Candidatus Goldbacteria bacterium]|nr:branched-chain-amino-acid transaminase [Candidatus Goldiibacteriota bacterium]